MASPVIKVRKTSQVLLSTVIVMLITVLLALVHVQVNYPSEMQDMVRPRAVWATVFITLPVTFLILLQVRKNNLLADELQRLVNRDRLTDAATRDFFFARMDAEPDAFGVSLMVDIDHFKAVNDTHGHLIGDTVIRAVSNILRRHCAESDIICRFGGEEFVIFLQDAGKERGQTIAENIRRAVSDEIILSEKGTITVTVSIGGSLKDRVDDINVSIREADAALYRAKAAGRNRAMMVWLEPAKRKAS